MKQLKILLSLLFISSYAFAQEITIPLLDNWTFKQVGTEKWMPAEIPGTVHTDLLNNGKIEDPLYRMNEKDQQWIEKEDWEYKTTFDASSEIITRDRILLDFQGLDTYADVYLNDSLILIADNMFRSWQVDVEGVIRQGKNSLSIYFTSPVNKTALIYDSLNFTYPVSSNDQAGKKVSIFSRKAPYHYGWDWGPRFVTSGIWKPIALRAWNTATIVDLSIEQKLISDISAELVAHLDMEVARPFIGELELVLDGISLKKSTVDLALGKQVGNISFSIPNPELWWPNGLGDQKLYEVNVKLIRDDKLIDSKKTRTGLRTIELVQEKDRFGSSFYFKVNDKAVFMKGANYIPQDNFITRVDSQHYHHILHSAAEANMNMIRVWGGGIYENDVFYDLCDEMGLLVWQDFMFSCAMYPGDLAFLENARQEAEEQVKRLRNHPSLAIWCGNNEILMKWSGSRKNANREGNQVPLWDTSADSSKIIHAYNDLFKNILPDAVTTYGRGVPFWESSPMTKGSGFNDWKSGDSHYWGVWWGQAPFESYRTSIGRFMSEYGFQSFPAFETVKTFTKESDWDIYSDVMQAHQRSSIGNKTIASYMERYFHEPKDFQNYLYVSQLLQAEGVKIAMEAHRIAKPYTMGSLIWQLNDCWPAASWSSIDYEGRWKALHYYAKRAFQTYQVAFEPKDDHVKIHIVSDSFDETRTVLVVELLDLNGKKILREEKKVKVKANSSTEVWKRAIGDLLKKQKIKEVYLRARLMQENELLADNIYLFVPYKELKIEDPGIKYEFVEANNKFYVELKANKTAFGVYFDIGKHKVLFSDNYFTLDAKEIRRIEVIGDFNIDEIKNKLTVRSLIDSYTP